jgi:myo-inositol-1-phosphate synthase
MREDRLGVMLVGMNGATANTIIIGAMGKTIAMKNSKKLGSILGIPDFQDVRFPDDRDMAFSGWDVTRESAYDAALKHEIIPQKYFLKQRKLLKKIIPSPGIFSNFDVKETKSSLHCSEIKSFRKTIEQVKIDIDRFKSKESLSRCIVVYLGPPLADVSYDFAGVHLDSLKKMIKQNSAYLTSAIAYAIASIESGCGFVDFTPNITLEIPGIIEMAEQYKVPLAGRDGNTGQSLMKTVIGEMLRIRNFRLTGWYSTNILGNNDGLVLCREDHRKLKMKDKLGVLEPILGYADFDHVVDISFYRPRGDNKEAWDNIDFLGWIGLPMSMKINWLGRDSILAAPLILDLVKHLWHSLENGKYGIQEHLAIYFKHPLGCGVIPFTLAFDKLKSYYGLKKQKETRQ